MMTNKMATATGVVAEVMQSLECPCASSCYRSLKTSYFKHRKVGHFVTACIGLLLFSHRTD